MNQTAHSTTTLSRRRNCAKGLLGFSSRHGMSPLLMAGLLTIVVGCGANEDHVAIEYPIEREVRDALATESLNLDASQRPFPALEPASSVVSPRTGDRAVESSLASFVLRRERPINWDFGGFGVASGEAGPDSKSGSAVRLVQAPTQPGVPAGIQERQRDAANKPTGLSGLAVGQVETIPTPLARPEVKAEWIPTPQGISKRDPSSVGRTGPVARIASDIEKSGANRPNQSSSPIDSALSEKKIPGNADLIDATTELGLVADQNGPEDFRNWPKPDAVLFVTGNQHGYIEPCGCTGLDKQKGGVARRFTFIKQLREKGWNLIPVDAGNQIRRIGQQASIKFEQSSSALKKMEYQAVGFGPSDMRLSATDLISVTYADSPEDAMFVSGNIVLLETPELLPTHKLVRQGEFKIGLTSILDPEALEAPAGSDIKISPIKEAASQVLRKMNAEGANFRVLTFFGEEEAAQQLMADVPGFDLIAVSGGYGEPTYRPQTIPGSETKMIVTGNKGMFAGLVALYQNQPMKYARVPLTHEFSDDPEMRKLMADYQKQLEQLGLSGLGLSPIPHPSGDKFVGTATCAKCHTTAFDIWEGTPHVNATESIVEPPEGRGDVPRHFDPECISCHVTGWNPQNYYPYESGYLDLEKSAHLTGSGCENCHGPGARHSAAEEKDSGVSEERKKSLRMAMQLPLEKAKEHCMKCHDLDNSPDFHVEDAFEDDYWPQVEHEGMD